MEPRTFQEGLGMLQGDDKSGQHDRGDLYEWYLDYDRDEEGRTMRGSIANMVR